MRMHAFLEFSAPVISAESDAEWTSGWSSSRSGLRGGHGLINKFEDAGKRFFNGIAAFEISVDAHPDGVGHIEPGAAFILEFAEEKSFVRSFREHELDGFEMTARHGENVGGIFDEFIAKWLAALPGDVDAPWFEHFHRVLAGGLSMDGGDPRGADRDIGASLYQVAHKTLGKGASADVSGADKKNVFHRA